MIAVVGLGFVGLTTALGLCEKGFSVRGYDKDEAKSAMLRQGTVPFLEPNLPEALARHGESGRFRATVSMEEALADANVVFLCVGTPQDDDGRADLSQLFGSLEEMLRSWKKGEYRVLVIKSTVPPSTVQERVLPFVEGNGFRPGIDLGLASNPEFLREGVAWEDFIHPDRIVIGVADERSERALRDIYAPFGSTVHAVSYTTAEFIKYLSNTLLSTLVSFSNEMSMIAHAIGDIDIPASFRILHEDRRWTGSPAKMASYVYPGCGFGGYCLPKDTQALYMQAKERGFDARGLRNVTEVNERIKDFVADRVEEQAPKTSVIGILGLSFKPDSDDVRDSPARSIISRLLDRGYRNIVAYDPLATDRFRSEFALGIAYAGSLQEAVSRADVLLLLTAWKEFRENGDLLRSKPIIDFRYCL